MLHDLLTAERRNRGKITLCHSGVYVVTIGEGWEVVDGCGIPLIGRWRDSEPLQVVAPEYPGRLTALVLELTHSTIYLVEGVEYGTSRTAGGWVCRPGRSERS
jgi:hypothetical protein